MPTFTADTQFIKRLLAQPPELTLIMQPGDTTAAEINSAIVSMSAQASSTSRAQIYLDRGTYLLDAPISFNGTTRNVDLILHSQAVLQPTYTGADDDPVNTAIKIAGSLNVAKMNTTLTAVAPKGASSIAVANAGTIAAGDYIVIEGSNTGGQDLGGHSGGLLGEVVQVASSYAGGLTIPLAWPLYQTHGTTGITAKAVTPAVGVSVTGGLILGSQGGVTTACGVHATYAVDVQVDQLAGEGFSRAAIDIESCTWFRSSGYLSRGNQNCWYFLSSVCGFDVEDFDGVQGVARVHASGLPRAQIYLRRRCTDGRIHDGRLVCGYAGIFQAGGQSITIENVHIRDQEITQAIYDRAVAGGEFQAGGKWALGWGAGHAPLAMAEFAIGCTYSNITTEDLRAPNATGWNDVSPRRAMAAYIHDTLRCTVSNIVCTHWDSGTPVCGIVFSDVDGSASNLIVKGHDFGVSFENFNCDIKVDNYRFDAVRGSSPNAVIPLYLNYDPSSNRGPRFNGIHSSNANSLIWFGGSFTGDANLKIRDLITDQGEWSEVVLGNNQSGTAFACGDIVEVDSANTGADLRIVTPNTGGTDYSGRLVAVASGPPDDSTGTGYLLVAPLPQQRATVKASTAAVAWGDRIGYAATRRAATVAGAAQPIGKALSRKAAGAEGMVRIGPVA